ncbi:Striatin-domain-containing protein [Suhomyces tanzawaensis NRRL Y-17324]|uniref:Striatin-domain-containing protein n=1 Tax=Suhomyces tanzawaensis NRRL Y-17324 TaxID=984487 RepID=A0A1E4SNL9_9ASCO|nr:Striatin-domain-containing protein [Suhomyces tanzawaensis NRRL Y-17324]ODV81119.1 Striatin-domain-containing protein [Suhomyces tanzawaensis NRRL Y-17324]
MNSSRLQTAGKPPTGGVPQVQWLNQQHPQHTQNLLLLPLQHQQLQLPHLLLHQQLGSYYSSANYSLPGVINYLTSEFTNLERFKIMTNLEKSEMKYKIIQLQCEVNSLKLVCDKQKSQISKLETENRKLKEQSTGEVHASSESGEDHPDSQLPEIPDVDLLVIKKSRQQLTKSMKEIVHLLKIPSAKNMNYLGIPETSDIPINNELDALVNHEDNFNDNFDFNDRHILSLSPRSMKKGKSVTSQYFGDEGEAPEAYVDFDDIKDVNVDFFNEKQFTGTQVSVNESRSLPYESDAETEILENVDEVVAPLDKQPLSGEEKHTNQQVFEDGEIQVHLTSISDEYRIEVFDKNAKKKVFSKDVYIDSVEPDKLISLHRIALEDSRGTFLAVQENGIVFSLTVETDNTRETELINLKNQKVHIQSSGLTELPHIEKTRKFGFVVNSLEDNFVIKVFQLTLKDGEFETKEIGSFNRNFITKNASSKHIEFDTWAVNNSAQIKPSSPKKKKGKAESGASAEEEETAFVPYELVYRSEDSLLRVNVVNKTIQTLPW